MRALILSDAGVRLAANAPNPTPASGEVLVRVTRAGICETDLQLVRGYMGFRGVLGHEFVGVAETGQFAGRRIVGEINCPCRHCDTCRSGRGNHCPNRTVLGILGRNGAFAEFLVLPEENLHLVPDAVSDEAAVFVEPLAAAFRIVEQIPLESTRRVVVLGDGRLGNLCAQVLAEHVPQVIVVGKHDAKLQQLARRGIATSSLDETRSALQAGRWSPADIVVEATGSPDGLPLAMQLVRPCGTIVLKTTVAGSQTLAMAPVVIDEVTVIGSRCGPFAPALAALAAGRIDVTSLISAVRPLDEAVAAFDEAASPGVLKVQLCLDPSGAA